MSELRNALDTCDESSPGPDGLSYRIYKDHWDLLGPELLLTWQKSQVTQKLTNSQRYSVINLIEKKDKDKTKIENLRPISLSNCDIKICTKAIALRTNAILSKILINTQCGYVPGRQVADNARYIEEIIKRAEETKQKLHIFTLDAQKAFDSVDHKYMEKCLRAYNFPESYIKNVKILYNDLTASVMVNGFTTNKFKISRSVKQGDALSCALFVICIDPLLRAIENDNNIKGTQFQYNNLAFGVKVLAYADDITIICSSLESIQATIDLYQKFAQISGIQLNVNKTEILIAGCPNCERIKAFKIKYNDSIVIINSQLSVKICGITFSTNPDIAYSKNISDQISKMQKKLNMWRQRNLTINGKILIVKTFGLSQIIFYMQQTVVREEDLQKIDNIVNRFIWNKNQNSRATGLLSKSLLKSSYESGGLNSPDVITLNYALKYKHLLRSRTIDHPLSTLYKLLMSESQMEFNFSPFVNKNDENKALKTSLTYLKQAFITHKLLNNEVEKDLLESVAENDDLKLHKNYFITIQNVNLSNLSYINKHQQSMVKKLKRHNIVLYAHLAKQQATKQNPGVIFETHQVYHSLPKWWKTILNKTNRDYAGQECQDVCIGVNKWIPSNTVTSKQIRLRLQERKNYTNANDRVNKAHNITIPQNINPFLLARAVTKVSYLRAVQYKTLLNIYPTKNLLNKWGIADSNACPHCNIKETVTHVIADCEIAQQTFKNLENLYNSYGNNLTLSKDKIVLCNIQDKALATVIILVKSFLLKQKEHKHALNINELTNIIDCQERIECKIEFKNHKLDKHKLRWGCFSLQNQNLL